MNLCNKAIWSLAAAACVLLLGGMPASAQTVTTGSLTGVVKDAQGGVLPGVTVTAVHTPTGTSYDAVTDAQGRFDILNVRVGPYDITTTMSGFKDEKQQAVDVALGEQRAADFKLQLASVSETVTVTGQSAAIDSSVAGTADNISNAVKEALPTITRSIADIVRVSPLFNSVGSGAGDGQSVVSVAGTSFRYNSLQIDGAANNDLFGLAGSAGAPGGAAESQPISLDAIQEIQLVVSPYDVRQGGFAGGGINAITKSGTNALHGTGVLLRTQPGLGRRRRRRPGRLDLQGQAGGLQHRRPDPAEQGVLLRHGRLRAQAAADGILGQRRRTALRQRGGREPGAEHSEHSLQLRSGSRIRPVSSSRRPTATSISSAPTSTWRGTTSSRSGTTTWTR